MLASCGLFHHSLAGIDHSSPILALSALISAVAMDIRERQGYLGVFVNLIVRVGAHVGKEIDCTLLPADKNTHRP
jgi:hypothetical protein